MASSKSKCFLKKKSSSERGVVISNLRKEKAYLQKALAELCRQHSEHNKLVERFLSLETMRLETYQQLAAKDKEIALPSEQLSKKEEKLMDVVSMRSERSLSSYAQEIEEIKNQIVILSTRCQYLKNKVAGKKDSTSAEPASTDNLTKLQNHLSDALEKNKQWLEYDQEREAYVRSILARMLWLERQLNEANQARSQQHNEEHSDGCRISEKEQIRQMQEHYEALLKEAKAELDVLGEQVDMTQQSLIIGQKQCEEKESEMEELRRQLEAQRLSGGSESEDPYCPEVEVQCLRDENKDLQSSLDAERRRSANFELQTHLSQTFLVNRFHADQEKIADLERQGDPQDCSFSEVAHTSSPPPRDRHTSSRHSSLLNESLLCCPVCQAEYPVRHYRELLSHLENCHV